MKIWYDEKIIPVSRILSAALHVQNLPTGLVITDLVNAGIDALPAAKHLPESESRTSIHLLCLNSFTGGSSVIRPVCFYPNGMIYPVGHWCANFHRFS